MVSRPTAAHAEANTTAACGLNRTGSMLDTENYLQRSSCTPFGTLLVVCLPAGPKTRPEGGHSVRATGEACQNQGRVLWSVSAAGNLRMRRADRYKGEGEGREQEGLLHK